LLCNCTGHTGANYAEQRTKRQTERRQISPIEALASVNKINAYFLNINHIMPVILPVKDKFPQMGGNCFIAPNATIVGDVIMGDDCSVWFNAVVRGDVNFIKMGNKVNLQDGACIHCTYQKYGTTIGNNVSIGHNAIVHGCTIHDNVLIGMGAIVMDNAVVHSNTIIAAGAVVLENTVCEPGSIYAGVPAKKVKDIAQEKISGEIDRIANNYVGYADWFREVK
jgi:carbonic anhydrase/acetyltransferase-like protein (isoleucine patch superfamily)